MDRLGDISSDRWLRDQVFNAAWAYDLAFAWDPEPEVETLLAMCELKPGARVLLPACGTGRIALPLARRGFEVEASDINPHMLAYARRRPHPLLSYSPGDMSRALGAQVPDCHAAFTLCNSLRYLLDDDEIAGHFQAVRERLRPGALYVTELALNAADERLLGVPNTWVLEYPGRRVTARWTVVAITPPTALEAAEIEVVERDGTRVTFSERQPQRLWTFRELLAAAGARGLELDKVWTAAGTPAADPELPGRYYVRCDDRSGHRELRAQFGLSLRGEPRDGSGLYRFSPGPPIGRQLRRVGAAGRRGPRLATRAGLPRLLGNGQGSTLAGTYG